MDTDNRDPRFDGEIAPFRQPMVTSIGIIMGFLLSFLANWAVDADDEPALVYASDFAVVGTLLFSVTLFTIALFRLLNNRIVADAGARYQRTLHIYMTAIVLAFVGLTGALTV
jgi:hypothetical protein